MIDENSQNISEYTFNTHINSEQQQNTIKCSFNPIIAFILLGFYFLIFAVIELITNNQQTHYKLALNSNGSNFYVQSGLISFQPNINLSVYLEMPQFTQFNKHFEDQGYDISRFGYQARNCKTYKFNNKVHKSVNILGGTLIPTNYAIPCGFYPALFPQGNLQIVNLADNSTISIVQTDLTLFDYSEVNLNPLKQWADFQDGRFQAWMEANAGITIRKLIGFISSDLSGYYSFTIPQINGFPTNISSINIILSNNLSLGGDDLPLEIINLCYASVSFLLSLILFFLKKQSSEQPESIQQNSTMMAIKASRFSLLKPTCHSFSIHSAYPKSQ